MNLLFEIRPVILDVARYLEKLAGNAPTDRRCDGKTESQDDQHRGHTTYMDSLQPTDQGHEQEAEDDGKSERYQNAASEVKNGDDRGGGDDEIRLGERRRIRWVRESSQVLPPANMNSRESGCGATGKGRLLASAPLLILYACL